MYYKNIRSEENIKIKDTVEEFHIEIENELKFIERLILDLGKEKCLIFSKKNNDLAEYMHYIDNIFRKQSHIQSKEIDKKIEINNKNIKNELMSYNKILSEINYGEIMIDGSPVKINSTNYKNYISDENRDRKSVG